MRSAQIYLVALLILVSIERRWSFSVDVMLANRRFRVVNSDIIRMNLFQGGAQIPSSTASRNSQAIKSVQNAISRPRRKDVRLIECEFPPLTSLNKLGDGSLQSSNAVDEANVTFGLKLMNSLGGFLGPKVWLITSSTASASLMQKAKKAGPMLHSLKNGIPDVSKGDVCVVLVPCVKTDYEYAKQLAQECKAVVIVNGIAKDRNSVPDGATMAYYLKPLTYNSQVAGYLLRSYPDPWTAIDATTRQKLASFTDNEILVRGTNTPDLRESGRFVQKSVDQRAIRSR